MIFCKPDVGYVEKNQSQTILNGLEGQSDQYRRETWKPRDYLLEEKTMIKVAWQRL